MSTFKKLQVFNLSSSARDAVKVVEVPMLNPGPNQVLIKNIYAGVNAVDMNIFAGRVFTDGKVPFDVGLEALGLIAKVGDGVTRVKVGDPIFCLTNQGYSEYLLMPADNVFPVPELSPKYLVAGIGGLAAAIALDDCGNLKKGEKVLITAAAGGTGHICVQWALSKGCHVIGLCSTKAKMNLLKSIGCSKIVNYKEEEVDRVLSAEYPNGIDVVWETMGGLNTALFFKHLAVRARMIVIGGITGYKEIGFPDVHIPHLFAELIRRSVKLQGFLVFQHIEKFPEYFSTLVNRILSGEIKAIVDDGTQAGKPFFGVNKVVDACEHLHSGNNNGKVVVKLQD